MTVNDFAPNLIWASPASAPNGQMGLRAMVAADLPAGVGTGTVTSVGLTAPAIFNVAGSPVTTAGSLNLGLANQSANQVWAGPASGGAAAPGFRALVASDIPSLSGTYLVKANNLSDVASASTSRTNLGLGSMATQNASAVAITGGTINIAGNYNLGGSAFVGNGGGGIASNIALGPSTLTNNTSGYQNIAIGSSALAANTTSYNNVAVGLSALISNTTGIDNIAVGSNALFDNVSGQYNTAIGSLALFSCTNSYNTAIGSSSLYSVTNGIQNIAIGYLCDVPSPTSNGQINIGGLFFGTGATATGTGEAGQAGIGTNAPRTTLDVNGPIATKVYTVATLPSPVGIAGARALVSDSTGTSFTAVVVGGGTGNVPVYSDGASWRIG